MITITSQYYGHTNYQKNIRLFSTIEISTQMYIDDVIPQKQFHCQGFASTYIYMSNL